MSQKKLESGSKYNKFDTDGDGIVTDEELAMEQKMIELENADKKADSQRQIAWLAAITMVVYALLPLVPFIPVERLQILATVSDMLFLSQASIIGMFFGAQAYMTKK